VALVRQQAKLIVPAMVDINRYDLNEINTRQVESYCDRWSIEVAAKIPYYIIMWLPRRLFMARR